MSVTVRRFEKDDADTWDKLIAESRNGTFLHQRRYLSHHGERFQDLSLVVEDKRGRITGVFPAALDPAQEEVVTSHPGLTYGGVIHNGYLRGTTMLKVLQAIAEAYQAIGLRFLQYKAVPYIYHKVPSTDDLYALFRLGAVRYRCDLSAAIDLTPRWRLSEGRRRHLKKAWRSGVQVALGASYLESFWAVLEENLAIEYGLRPVHTLQEITWLHNTFPEHTECMVGVVGGEVVAGVVLFCTPQVVHVQYSASNATGKSVSALTAVVDNAVKKSKDLGVRYFDFGISNERGGRELNEGLYGFKTSFGAGGVVHESYELDLNRA